jgi:hypothetical protein
MRQACTLAWGHFRIAGIAQVPANRQTRKAAYLDYNLWRWPAESGASSHDVCLRQLSCMM